eukprot:1180843-Prorocentrum_minimum.AAC.5
MAATFRTSMAMRTVATSSPSAERGPRGPRPLPPPPKEVRQRACCGIRSQCTDTSRSLHVCVHVFVDLGWCVLQIRVCNGPRCSGKGAHLLPAWLSLVKEASGSTTQVGKCECLGECEFGPNMQLLPTGKVANRTRKLSDVARALSLRLPEDVLEQLEEKAALQEVQASGSEAEAAAGKSNAQLILATAKKAVREKESAAAESTTAVKLVVCQGSTCSKRAGANTRVTDMKAIAGERASCVKGECMGACKYGPNIGLEAEVGAAGGRVDGMNAQERMSGCFVAVNGEEEMKRLWSLVEPVADMAGNKL